MAKFTESVDALLEIAQGVNAFPSVATLSTQTSKVSGFEMPISLESIVNFKVAVPNNLDAAPNGKIRMYIMNLDTNTTDNIEFQIKTHATTSLNSVDIAFTDETIITFVVPNANRGLVIRDISLSIAPVNGQFITGQIVRRGDQSGDTAQSILLLKVQLLVDVDVT